MREILFRGKRKDNGEWIQGGIYVDGDRIYIITLTQYRPDTRDWNLAEYYENHPVYRPTYVEVIPETVGQFTGVTDKNGKKIFEGDIVNVEEMVDMVNGCYQVIYSEVSHCFALEGMSNFVIISSHFPN